MAFKSTLEAMTEQETVYFSRSIDTSTTSSTTTTDLKQAVATLETIYDLLSLQDRDTLVMATYYLVQYYHHHATPRYPVSHVALICFYMAVKIHQTTALPMKSLSDLQARFFGDQEPPVSWSAIEMDVCMTLRWRLHPPLATAFSFRMTRTPNSQSFSCNMAAAPSFSSG